MRGQERYEEALGRKLSAEDEHRFKKDFKERYPQNFDQYLNMRALELEKSNSQRPVFNFYAEEELRQLYKRNGHIRNRYPEVEDLIIDFYNGKIDLNDELFKEISDPENISILNFINSGRDEKGYLQFFSTHGCCCFNPTTSS